MSENTDYDKACREIARIAAALGIVDYGGDTSEIFDAIIIKDEKHQALITQLEAAQKERDELKELNCHFDLSIRKTEGVNEVLRSKLEAAERALIKPLPIGELVHRLEGQTYEKWFSESDVKDLRERAEKAEAALSAANEKPKPISFDELADRVQFVTGGIRMSFDPLNCKGHQIVPFMNFNSLSRIVEMYRTTETYHLAGFTVEGE
ncbi:hypothetical protein [Yersinia pseudotuberculosis]|uniref:hypothetical protein n=1 Tax=Yersinia pseudotuberculosis TaxID=633 RepID=UPI001A9E5368|nr:hypothetical protein [Yersinia pseudotuberculosis]MBO1561833.1 hypothetical protein [Yersinia pseudotuberculosis]